MAKRRSPAAPSKWEQSFAWHWRLRQGPELAAQSRLVPNRDFRFDFAHERTKVAIEIEGGTWARGAHSRGRGYAEDCEKYNAAAALGWTVFRLTSDMLTRTHLELVMDAIRVRAKAEEASA